MIFVSTYGDGRGFLVGVYGRFFTRSIVQPHFSTPEGLQATYHNFSDPKGSVMSGNDAVSTSAGLV